MSKKIIWKEPFDLQNLERFVDDRGMLFEIMRFKDQSIPGNGQLYTFSINPNQRRGDHYHLEKHEWFTCVYGKAIVLLTSKEGEDKAVELSANNPQIIYAAPGTSHALLNKEDTIAVIVSYGSKQHDPENEDTYRKLAFEEYGLNEI